MSLKYIKGKIRKEKKEREREERKEKKREKKKKTTDIFSTVQNQINYIKVQKNGCLIVVTEFVTT